MQPWLIILLLLIFLFLIGIAVCYLWISLKAKPYIYKDLKSLPFRKTTLILGTAKLTSKGGINHYFVYRVAKAVDVYNGLKTKQLLISGADKSSHFTDEVDDMYEELLENSIQPKALVKDHGGNRTWSSMWRCKKVFKIYDPIIVSQQFHNERAIFIGLRMGMKPVAVNAEKVKGKAGIKMFFRELLARVKCLLDCYLLHPVPEKK